jgi:hypothetical protein
LRRIPSKPDNRAGDQPLLGAERAADERQLLELPVSNNVPVARFARAITEALAKASDSAD